MSEITVFRYVNVLYYIIFTAYILIFLIYLLPRRKEEPYKNAYKIFWAVSIVLIAMEFYGSFSGIRFFYIGGEHDIFIQLLLQIIMGFAEGGTSTGIMYLMVESVYDKKPKIFLYYSLYFSLIMLSFAVFTFLYKL